MEIAEHKHGAVTVVKPVGPLVQPAAEELLGRMLELRTASLGRLVLDGSGITYVDSRGLEVLTEIADALEQGGRALKICGANDILREVFDLTDLTKAFEHFIDVNTAVRSFL